MSIGIVCSFVSEKFTLNSLEVSRMSLKFLGITLDEKRARARAKVLARIIASPQVLAHWYGTSKEQRRSDKYITRNVK